MDTRLPIASAWALHLVAEHYRCADAPGSIRTLNQLIIRDWVATRIDNCPEGNLAPLARCSAVIGHHNFISNFCNRAARRSHRREGRRDQSPNTQECRAEHQVHSKSLPPPNDSQVHSSNHRHRGLTAGAPVAGGRTLTAMNPGKRGIGVSGLRSAICVCFRRPLQEHR